MSPRTLRILAVAVVVLFAAVWLLNRERGSDVTTGAMLFPDLKERLDAVTALSISDADGEIRIVREGDRWIVPAKEGYGADTAVLRELLLGIAEARRIEEKTSNSELYDRLGVQDPQEGGASGVLVESEGLDDADFSLILGDAVQGEYRYVRIAGEPTSWLIDRNPDVPDEVSGWLVSDIADIPSSRVQSVTISHADGQTIAIRKEDEADTNFTVEGIPEGRELSYPSVANSIAAVLDGLALDDVRPAGAGSGAEEGENAPVTTVFTTFDGLEITVDSTSADDETWISLRAAALPEPEGTGADQAGDADETGETEAAASAVNEGAGTAVAAQGSETGGGETDAPADQAEDATAAGGDATTASEEAEAPDPAAEAAAINERVSGWEYRIPEYKANQLRRGWEDLLSDAGDAAE